MEALLTSKNIIPNATINDARMAREPMIPPIAFGILLQNIPFIKKPINGKSGTK